ncbi:hypothetical protein PHMEG_00040821, partial [Phytophthora megakarya]
GARLGIFTAVDIPLLQELTFRYREKNLTLSLTPMHTFCNRRARPKTITPISPFRAYGGQAQVTGAGLGRGAGCADFCRRVGTIGEAHEASKKGKKPQKKGTRRSSRAKTTEVDEETKADGVMEDEDVNVHVMWLNKKGRRYGPAYDEQVDVASILCHVYLRELSNTALELTPKSVARVSYA